MNRTVLYIEDDANNAHLVERLFRGRPGIQVQVAGSARDGLAAALGGPPALILLDNHLPDAAGRDVLRQLAASERTRGIPVIILSGDTDPATADDLLAHGAADFIVKPFDIDQFMVTVDRHLA